MAPRRSEPIESSQDPAFFEALGRAIQVLRVERGMARKELAEASGVSYPYLSEIENGKKRPSSESLMSIAGALGLRTSGLLEQAEAYREAGVPPPSPPAYGEVAVASLADAVPVAPAAPAAAPMMMAASSEAPPPAATARQSWFRPSAGTRPAPGAGPRTRTADPLEELAELARSLAPEDVERLVDLARRLSRS